MQHLKKQLALALSGSDLYLSNRTCNVAEIIETVDLKRKGPLQLTPATVVKREPGACTAGSADARLRHLPTTGRRLCCHTDQTRGPLSAVGAIMAGQGRGS